MDSPTQAACGAYGLWIALGLIGALVLVFFVAALTNPDETGEGLPRTPKE